MAGKNGDNQNYRGLLSGTCRHCRECIPKGQIECPNCGAKREFNPEEYEELVQSARTGNAQGWKPEDELATGEPGDPTDPGIVPPISPLHGGLCAAKLEGADFRGLDLGSVNLSGSCLYGADLSSAQLQGACLTWADLEGANLCGAQLEGASLCLASLKGADLSKARLVDVDLTDADLTGADLSGADLSKIYQL